MSNDSPAVRLRDVTDADLPILFEHQRDSIANEMADFPARDYEAFMAHWVKIRAIPTAIQRVILAGDEVAGNIVSWEHDGEREVGYWLDRQFWGQGIATRALTAFLDVVATRPLYAYVVTHNVASRRVLEKCGFVVYDTDDVGFLLRLDAPK